MVLSVIGFPAWAQGRGSHIADRAIKIEQPNKQSRPSAQKACREYGSGFIRVEGSSTCVHVGGSTSVNVLTGR
ncbi:hypothetical protein NB311A_18818 [Nitrobacter sp. Nb-311A]|nr:hypothetical protein NB311A_18818 [Nitrobacter sp. Nb-311A]